jgi:hypothetical protein
MGVLTGLKNHGVQDILIACMDGLSVFLMRYELFTPKRGFSFASSIWSEILSNLFPTKTLKNFAPT